MIQMFYNFFINDALMPFHISVLVLLSISLIETIGFYFGIRPLHFLKYLLPVNFDNPILSIKFSKILIIIFFLINFSFAGYFLQLFCYAYFDSFAPLYYVLAPIFIIAVFFTVFMVHCLDQVIKPRYTHKPISLLGRLATICNTSAKPEIPAKARVRDEYGNLHYIQVLSESGEIPAQSQIVLIKTQGHFYIGKEIIASNHLFDFNIFPEY